MAANTWWDILPPSFIARRPQREPPGPADSEAVYGQQTTACKWDLYRDESKVTTELRSVVDLRGRAFTSLLVLPPRPPPGLSLSFSQQPCDQICLTCRCCVPSPQSQSARFRYVLRIGACRTDERRTECLHLSPIGGNYSYINSAEKRKKWWIKNKYN